MKIGIDSSFTSPGITVEVDNMLYFYFFSNKKKYENFFYKEKNIMITCFKKPEFEYRIQDMKYYVNIIIKSILNIINDTNTNNNINVGIEGYSYNSALSQGASKLYELGGILRYELFNNFNIIPQEFPPTTIKKYFTGSGTSTKFSMVHQFISCTNLDWFNILNIKQDIQDLSPLSDIADSYAVMKYITQEKINQINIVDNIIQLFE
jgi:hypothetical protein